MRLRLFYGAIFVAVGAAAQYNQPDDRDQYRTDSRDQYGNNSRDQYGNNSRDQYGNNSNRDQYGNNSRDQYGNPINRDRDQYGNPINNRDQYGNPINSRDRDQYGNPINRDQYGNPTNRDGNYSNDYNRDRNSSRDQYGNPIVRDQYGNPITGTRDRDQYGNPINSNNRDQYGNPITRDQYGNPINNRDRDQYGNPVNRDRDQYGNPINSRDRDQYGNNRDQYGNSRDRDQYGNPINNRDRDQYGNNNRDRNRDPNDPYYNRNPNDPYNNYNNRDNNRNPNDPYNRNFNPTNSPYGNNNYGGNRGDCYATDPNQYANFGTKTAYQIAYGKSLNKQHFVPDCTPVQFWSLNRHGARYPSAQTIRRLRELKHLKENIVNNNERSKSSSDRDKLCEPDFDLLKLWRWNESISEERANALTSQGYQDVLYLARRYASNYREIFNETYSDRAYTFQYTDTDRTHDTYEAYIQGLFNERAFQVHANMFSSDNVLRASKYCRVWQEEVEHNYYTLNEYRRFTEKDDYKKMVRDVFTRLGFRYTLNESVIEDMYDMCRLEKAWELHRHSPWCGAFTKDHFKLLEYAEDLKYYYKAGHGNPINRRVGCPLVKDLYDKFERTVNGVSDGNKVTAYFTHSNSFLTFLTAMGIAKDREPLTADNYFNQNRRQWSTSKIDPFAANLAAVLYSCTNGERHRVMFFLNENPVQYPECSVGLCNWSTVKMKLEDVARRCNLDFCDGNAATALHFNHLSLLLATLFSSLYVLIKL